MKQSQLIMGMPVTLNIPEANQDDLKQIFNYFRDVDAQFSPYKAESELSQLNSGKIKTPSNLMQQILDLCEETKNLTDGYFDIKVDGRIDPSGLVKGWAIYEASKKIRQRGFIDFYLDVGGDIQVGDVPYTVGIRNPFNTSEIIKVLKIKNMGVATSGTYERGLHIYNPKTGKPVDDIVSLTVIGPNIYEADRFATPAFAMGKSGIEFINTLHNFAGYMIDISGRATFTDNFSKYVASP